MDIRRPKYPSYAIPAVALLQLVLILFFSRTSLFLLFLPIMAVLLVSLRRFPGSFKKIGICITLILFLVVAIPIDISFQNTGTRSVRLLPAVWGLPTVETNERIMKGEVIEYGCLVPLHPVRKALVISY